MSTERKIAILYGSETGNAQDYAGTLARKLEFLRFQITLSSLNDFDPKSLLDIPILIVVCSTTGQGELPRNSKKFFKFLLRKKLPADLLNHIKFTTFGLGDSSYPKFNFAIRKIHARLLQLGATEFSMRCESDEQSPEGSDGYFSEWQATLVKSLEMHYPLPEGVEPINEDTLLLPKNEVVIHSEKFDRSTEDTKAVAITRQDVELKIGEIVLNERVTSEDHFQDVRHVKIRDLHNSLDYEPGDTAALYPSNDPDDVSKLIEAQDWTEIADKPMEITGKLPSIEGGLTAKLTLRSLLTHHLDIMSIPRRSFFLLVWHFASEEREREKLQSFSSLVDAEDLYNYANRPRRSILETILEFFSLKIPVKYIFDLIPTIKPRLFSIASKPDASTVELVIAVVEYKTILRRVRKGLCTNWLKTLSGNDKICFSIHKSGLKFGETQPIIMIAPGTGVAPMKSLIEYKAETSSQDLALFYGCRFHDKDYLFAGLWEGLEKEGKLELFHSFSRENGGYVQTRLYEQRKSIAQKLIQGQGIVFVCGSNGSMPTQVRITIETVLKEEGGLSEDGAREYLLNMENTGRYIQETW